MASQFQTELNTIAASRPPISSRSIKKIIQIVHDYKDEASDIVQCLERFIKSVDHQHCLSSLYVIDAIMKSTEKYNTVYPQLFNGCIATILSTIKMPSSDMPKFDKLKKLWKEGLFEQALQGTPTASPPTIQATISRDPRSRRGSANNQPSPLGSPHMQLPPSNILSASNPVANQSKVDVVGLPQISALQSLLGSNSAFPLSAFSYEAEDNMDASFKSSLPNNASTAMQFTSVAAIPSAGPSPTMDSPFNSLMLQQLLAGVSSGVPQPVINAIQTGATHQEVYADDYASSFREREHRRDSRDPQSRPSNRDRSRSPHSRPSAQRRNTTDDHQRHRGDDDYDRKRHDDRQEARGYDDRHKFSEDRRSKFESKDEAQFHQIERDGRFNRDQKMVDECEKAFFNADIPEGNVRVLSRTIYVGNVSPDVTTDTLREGFKHVARVETIVLNYDNFSAFVKMYTRKEAEAARALNELLIGSTTIKIGWCCGYGPRNHFNRDTGTSQIPLYVLPDVDKTWMATSARGGGPAESGMQMEEPFVGFASNGDVVTGTPGFRSGGRGGRERPSGGGERLDANRSPVRQGRQERQQSRSNEYSRNDGQQGHSDQYSQQSRSNGYSRSQSDSQHGHSDQYSQQSRSNGYQSQASSAGNNQQNQGYYNQQQQAPQNNQASAYYNQQQQQVSQQNQASGYYQQQQPTNLQQQQAIQSATNEQMDAAFNSMTATQQTTFKALQAGGYMGPKGVWIDFPKSSIPDQWTALMESVSKNAAR